MQPCMHNPSNPAHACKPDHWLGGGRRKSGPQMGQHPPGILDVASLMAWMRCRTCGEGHNHAGGQGRRPSRQWPWNGAAPSKATPTQGKAQQQPAPE